jgi:type IX secretion system PorP/SprF family membrane protein
MIMKLTIMKNISKGWLIILMSVLSLSGFAQQDPQYSMHLLNGMSIHPGYAGSLGGISANVLYRSQWSGMAGAPKTISANAQMRYFKDQLGTGIQFFNDRIGVFNRTSVSVAQAYHLRLDPLTIAFGLQTSYQQFSANLTDTNPVDVQDPVFGSNVSKSIFNFGAGVYAYSDKFWFGASMPYFLKSKWNDGLGTIDPYLANHWFVSGGGILDVSIFQIKPSMMIKKSSNAPVAFETGCSVYAFSKFGLGVNYRIKDALMFIGEFQVNDNFKLAYCYDKTTSALRSFNNGTHEILLRYTMNNGGKATSSPRLF